jgi:hypothetical protein
VKNRIYYDWDFAPMSFVFEDTDNSGENWLSDRIYVEQMTS